MTTPILGAIVHGEETIQSLITKCARFVTKQSMEGNGMSDRLTLITNLDFVKPHDSDIRLYVWALLIEQNNEKQGFLGPTRKVRGFLSDGSLPVFDKFLYADPLPLKFTDAQGADIFIGCDGKEKPLLSGAILELAGGEKFDLFLDDAKRPLDVMEFTDYGDAWEALPGKVAEYWHRPNIPLPSWVSAESVRRTVKI